jgi:hypothetical protein
VDKFKQEALSKIPEVTLIFWIIKIAATTLGETGGDTVTMTLDWGYLAGSLLFLAALIALVAAQIRASKFHPLLYWATIVWWYRRWSMRTRLYGWLRPSSWPPIRSSGHSMRLDQPLAACSRP